MTYLIKLNGVEIQEVFDSKSLPADRQNTEDLTEISQEQMDEIKKATLGHAQFDFVNGELVEKEIEVFQRPSEEKEIINDILQLLVDKKIIKENEMTEKMNKLQKAVRGKK